MSETTSSEADGKTRWRGGALRRPLVGLAAIASVAGCLAAPALALSGSHPGPSATTAATKTAPIKLPLSVVPGSAKGLTIGVIDGTNPAGILPAVNAGLKAAAKKAGANYRFCAEDTNPPADVLNCLAVFKQAKVDGVILFNTSPPTSARNCAAYKDATWVAIISPNPPCAKAFVTNSNTAVGIIAGKALGNYAKTKWNCQYDAYVSLGSPNVGAVNTQRMSGYKQGLEKVCGKVPGNKRHPLVVDGTATSAATQFRSVLQALPNAKRIVVGALNDPSLTGVLAAAKQLGRSGDIVVAGQGAGRDFLQNVGDPAYIGDVNYWPEYYGEVAVAAFVALHNKKKIPYTLNLPGLLITKQNVNTYFPGTLK